jgi:hypothetical protein
VFRAFGQIVLAFSTLKNSPAPQQSHDQDDHGDDQENMDKVTANVESPVLSELKNYHENSNE